jgi:hypothetical protein
MSGFIRLVTFEANDEAIDAVVKEIEGSDGPPPGVAASKIAVLADRSTGKLYIGTLFESAEALDAADAIFNAMTPPEDGSMRRTAVDKLEVLLVRSA